MYANGKSQNPPVAVVSAAAFLYLAYSVRQGSSLFRPASYSRAGLYCTAAALVLGIIPYTAIFMTKTKTNSALLDMAYSKAALSDQAKGESSKLMDRWVVVNGVRALFPILSPQQVWSASQRS
jgi:hypothetical protein